MQSFDVVIVGAGAAGLFCAGVAGQLGLKVLVLDHSEKVAEKIRISGGGRANFTNMDVTANNFLSDNPRFAKSALSRFTPADFVALVKKHGIAFHEKHKGQLFCDRSAEDLIAMLLAECAAGGVERWQPCGVKNVRFLASSPYGESASSYEIDSNRGTIHCGAVVIASGGLSIPKIGATDFGYRVAKQFDLPVVTPRPALVPLTFDEAAWAPFSQLSGLSLPVSIETGGKKDKTAFLEDLQEGSKLVYRCGKQRSEPTSDKRGAKVDELHLTPLELIDRIAALVPPPRTHRHRYFGVLAPNSPLRAAVTALATPAQAAPVLGASISTGECAPGVVPMSSALPSQSEPVLPKRAAHYLWAVLIARIYEVFPLLCPLCGGHMRIIAFITHSADIRHILDHIGADSEPPRISPARGPPLWDDCSDAQMDDGAQTEPADWDLAAQPAPDFEVDQRISW